MQTIHIQDLDSNKGIHYMNQTQSCKEKYNKKSQISDNVIPSMVVRNCDESPSSLQVLESKVQTFSLGSQENETHLTETKRKCKIIKWVFVIHSTWPLIHLREKKKRKRKREKVTSGESWKPIETAEQFPFLSLLISFVSSSNQLLHFLFLTFWLNREIKLRFSFF